MDKYDPDKIEKKWPRTRRCGVNKKYNPAAIESKWQKIWQEKGTYQPNFKKAKCPFYNLMMFPYPSAEGLHVGNVYAFTGSDIYGRYQRMKEFDVFEPIGLDGFGIHSENYAIKVCRHPVEQAKISQKNFYRQLRSIGNSFAWKNTLETYDPDYYKWTQWIFIQLFKAGLAYRKKAPVNFCPSCKTVLSDEQVIAGACERCKSMVEKKSLAQWFFRITKYADRLNQNLDSLVEGVYGPGKKITKKEREEGIDWSEKVKIAQRNWIGKKLGIDIDYPVVDKRGKPVKLDGKPLKISCFTTRPDTNFGATFVVLAPEHSLVEKLLKITPGATRRPRHLRGGSDQIGHSSDGGGIIKRGMSELEKTGQEIRAYLEQAKKKTPMERIAEGKEKTGVFTGLYCLNQLNNYKMPLFISDFVLMEFGTGAVVGVPGHDERDFEFAKQFKLPIIQVIKPSLIVVNTSKRESQEKALKRLNEKIQKGEQAYEGPGVIINSGEWNGLQWPEDQEKILKFLERKGWGKRMTSYRLRDWCISRQRYWGPPIPMIYCKGCAKKGIIWQDLEGGRDTSDLPAGKAGVSRSEVPPRAAGIAFGDARPRWALTPRMVGRSEGTSRTSEKVPRTMEESEGGMAGWFPVSESKLPVLLPKVKDWRPEGEGKGPLDKIPEFYKTKCPRCDGPAKRETDVSDTFLDSAWYFLRYPSVEKDTSEVSADFTSEVKEMDSRDSLGVEAEESLPWDPKITKRWLPVDMYIGGAEHSVLHLLYSRFLTMVFKDLGLLDFEEPFRKFRAHGLLISEGAKMSKSRGNIVIPDEYIKKYSTDTLRMYLMFLGPFSQGGDFRDVGIRGIYRFLERVWRLVNASQQDTSDGDPRIAGGSSEVERVKRGSLNRIMHKTIKKVTEDIESLSYNTAIAALMEYLNKLQVTSYKLQGYKGAIKTLLLLLAPFAPYITEELWQTLSQKGNGEDTSDGDPRNAGGSSEVEGFRSIYTQPWPQYDPKLVKEEKVTVVIEINGKVRGEINIKYQISNIKKEVEKLSRREKKVKKYLAGKKIKRVVFIPGRLINFVTV